MDNDTDNALDARRRKRFGHVAGYLHRGRAVVDEWQRKLKRRIVGAKAQGTAQEYSPAAALAVLIERDGTVSHDDGPPIRVNAQIAVAR